MKNPFMRCRNIDQTANEDSIMHLMGTTGWLIKAARYPGLSTQFWECVHVLPRTHLPCASAPLLLQPGQLLWIKLMQCEGHSAS